MNCYACDAELKPVFADLSTTYQFDNAMWIQIHGGYAMFTDNLDEMDILSGADHRVVICHDCAHAACEALPWLDRLIQPLRSHAHTLDYWAEHPDHDGWDKKVPQK